MLDVKLRYLPKWISHRRKIAELYGEGLRDVSELTLPHFDDPAFFDIYQNYVIRTPKRDGLREHLKASGVETLIHWAKPVWEHQGLALGNPDLLETKSICQEVISLPMSAETTAEHVEIVVDVIREFFAKEETPVLKNTGS